MSAQSMFAVRTWMGVRMMVFLVCLVAIVYSLVVGAVSAHAQFGFKPGSVSTTFENREGVDVVPQASSHPYAFTVSFSLNENGEGQSEGGDPRDVLVDLPKGMSGDPLAVPRCTRQDFEGLEPKCSPDTQVGSLNALIAGIGLAGGPIYNLVPPPGMAAQLGFSITGFNALQNISVLSEQGYALNDTTNGIPLAITSVAATIWGDPANPGHDSQRGRLNAAGVVGSPPVASTAPDQAFLTLPANCDAPLQTTVEVDSKLDPGHYVSATAESLDTGGHPASLLGCGSVPFSPSVAAQPTTRNAGSPSGLDFELALPDEGLLNPGGTAETQPSKVVVALPEGFTANPSFAEGITGCSEAQYQSEQIETGPGEGCPETSKLGSVIAKTPLIEEPVEGSLYLAEPYKNKFGSLLAIYMVLRAPERGVLIKQVGDVKPNPVTGQLVTSFEGLPPLPYNTFHLHFREGARAPLATPPTCGQFKTVTQLTPFSSSEPVERDSFFTIEHGTEGSACPTGGTPPFNPGLSAGTANNAAGAYSPLNLQITRKDGEQEITGFTTQLPEGLTANLNGIPFCSEAQIALARSKTGAAEEAEPSCPAGSQIGHSQVGVGVGTVLAYAPGKLYLGGPFEGAPFSIVSISAAKVGPFDLGTVVVHLPLQVDPTTARVSIPQGPADQIPHIIDGIIVHVRDIQIYVDRGNFTSNPTSCEKKMFAATVYGSGQDFSSPSDDVPAGVGSSFQAADCANLAFKPAFSATMSGKVSKADGTSLNVKLTAPAQGAQNAGHEEANIHYVKVELPKQLPSRLTTLQQACTAAQFHTNPAGCPAASVVGHGKAITPILPVPLEGPAYFVSNGGEAFQNLVLVLQGYGITIDLVGSTFISKTGITSSTFKTVPDQPVTSFELMLPSGPYSALTAIGNPCTQHLSMPTEFIGQNGAQTKQSTPLAVTGCPKTKVPTRAQKLALALKACHKKPKGKKRQACERAARKKYGQLKKAKKGSKRK
ncbi:MAG TPA: hypothetical protein VGI24_03565 [Solirubrobacteraceae bacterium]